MIKVPKKVRIGGIDYTVNYKRNITDGFYVCDGMINCKDATIELDKEIKGSVREKEVILHEILHGIFYHFTVLKDGCANEEEIVNALSRGLLQVIEDNPILFSRGDNVSKNLKKNVSNDLT